MVATGEVMEEGKVMAQEAASAVAKEAVTVMATEVAKEAATVVATVVRWRQWKNGGERRWRRCGDGGGGGAGDGGGTVVN